MRVHSDILQSGIGIGWTEFAINIPFGCLSVYIATQLFVHASWRWAYYIGIIYAVIVLVGTFVFYFPPSRPQHDYEKSRWQEFKELDFVGLGLFSAGLTLFLVGITYLGRTDYSVALVASTITIGAIVFALAFVYDFTIPKNPIFPLKLLSMWPEFTVYLVILWIAAITISAPSTPIRNRLRSPHHPTGTYTCFFLHTCTFKQPFEE